MFATLIDAMLQEVQYIGITICYFEFSNGKRLLFASRDIGDRKRGGTFHIRADNQKEAVEQLRIEYICAINGYTFASTATEYSKETDFMRLCNPSKLCIRDMINLLEEGYQKYMAAYAIYHTIHRLLLESDICHKSFEKLQKLLDDATVN